MTNRSDDAGASAGLLHSLGEAFYGPEQWARMNPKKPPRSQRVVQFVVATFILELVLAVMLCLVGYGVYLVVT